MKFSGAIEADCGARPGVQIPVPVAEGDLLAGKYRIEEVIGQGGMGVVVAATNVELDQRVAVKFLLPHAFEDPSTVARFAREARALAKLESEHVAHVLDVGTVPGTREPYMVLECLSGRNLADMLASRGTFEIGEAVSYILEACKVMVEAHGLGIIHRDLKPENLFLAESSTGEPIIKVIDFGISKMSCDASLEEQADSALTTASTVVGSPLYMSPEQLRAARNVDARSDIWSLGVTLYELLAGEGPFKWSTVPELCAGVLKDPARPLRGLRPEVPEGLEAAVMRCLEKDPARRFADVGELRDALRPFAAQDTQSRQRTSYLLARSHWPRRPPVSIDAHRARAARRSRRVPAAVPPEAPRVELEPTEAGVAMLPLRLGEPRSRRVVGSSWAALGALCAALAGGLITALIPGRHAEAIGAATPVVEVRPAAAAPPPVAPTASADPIASASAPTATPAPKVARPVPSAARGRSITSPPRRLSYPASAFEHRK